MIWKEIYGYEGRYQISDFGVVKTVYKEFEKELKQQENHKGYYTVSLCKNGKHKTFFVHRLVAMAFLENPQNLPEVNHKDENPKNNCLSNLEWCDRKYNMNYGNVRYKIGKGHIKSNAKGGDLVSVVEKMLNFRAKHNLTQGDLAKILGITVNMVFRYENGVNSPSKVNQIRFENKMKEYEVGKNV